MVSNSLRPHGLKAALLSMEYSRKEYWSELLFPTPGNIPKPEIEPRSLASPASAGRLFPTSVTNHLLMYPCISSIGRIIISMPSFSKHVILIRFINFSGVRN